MNQKNTERDQLQQELASNESKLAQLKHQQERLENRITYYEKGERKNEPTGSAPLRALWRALPQESKN